MVKFRGRERMVGIGRKIRFLHSVFRLKLARRESFRMTRRKAAEEFLLPLTATTYELPEKLATRGVNRYPAHPWARELLEFTVRTFFSTTEVP